MKILSAEQTRLADDYTINHEPISPTDLMERASKAFVKQFKMLFEVHEPIFIFCGTGNNGGDGLAIGRLLQKSGYKITIIVVGEIKNGSGDFKTNFERLLPIIKVYRVKEKSDLPEIPMDTVIIDAIFGSGLSRPVDGIHKEAIDHINRSGNRIVSVDIASGLFLDNPVDPDRSIKRSVVKPTFTISFQFPKLAFLMPENQRFVGDWKVVDIGLMKEFTKNLETPEYVDKIDIIPILKKRKRHSHKGTFGRVMIIAGSQGKVGAAVLASKSCLRSGAGLLIVHVPESGYQIMQTAIPEAMVSIDPDPQFISKVPDLTKIDVVGIGPGINTKDITAEMFENLLDQFQHPMVIDADAINILSRHKDLISKLPADSILTPHAREFERLTQSWKNSYERIELQKKFSIENNVFIVFKGAYTTISTPGGDTYFNSTGNPGMATAGSGDVLTGIITALLAQGYAPKNAAIIGVYLHGLAGDLAVKGGSQHSLIASDIIEAIPNAYQQLELPAFG